MKLPRWAHRLYANAFGYFWLPCPVCGVWRGGHERNPGHLSSGGTVGWMYCSSCVARYGPELLLDEITITTCRMLEVPLALVVHDLKSNDSPAGDPS